MSVLRLLSKDTRLLVRSPALAAMLLIYPLIVALLAAVALRAADAPPRIALVNNDDSALGVRVGDDRITIDDYIARLREDVDLTTMQEDEAQTALSEGRIQAVLTIPSGFISALSTGVQRPTIGLDTNPRSPVEGAAITRRVEAAVYRFNQRLAVEYVDQVTRLANLIIDGGNLGVFGRTVNVIGLTRSEELLRDLQNRAQAQGDRDLAGQIEPLLTFISQTQANLGLVEPAAAAIASPVVLSTPTAADGREPLSAFAVAVAVLVSVGLAGVLLGASGVASEREEGTALRLRLGGVNLGAVVAAKAVFAAAVCLVIGVVLLGVIEVATDITVGRWGWWIPALFMAGGAFGIFGGLLGALAPDARTALLAGLLLSVPLIFLGMVPGDLAGRLAHLTPFGPAFAAFRDLMITPNLGRSLTTNLGLLAVMMVVLGGVATAVLRSRPGR